ncbi:MAG TPA: serine hydrolase domain-containing protein [Bauldia sp.]|nr:serine hydrolase domain-containing protein [Bauldia sp.]
MANLETRLTAAVDAAAEAGIAGGKIVGAATRVTLDGRLVYTRALGFADREAGVKLHDDMIFRLASMSKSMVAATALALVERGKLGLDDPASRYLPTFRPKLKDGTAPDLLVRQLMTHTSGLTYGFVQRPGHPYHRANVSDGMDQPGLSMAENLQRIASVPLEFAPGTAWGYSVSIDVLGAVIAAANDSTLAEAVRRYVTEPLGMSDTGFAPPDRARLVTPYADGGATPVRMGDPQRVARPEDPETHLVFSPARVFDEDSFQSGGAGMNGTTADYTRFMEALRMDGGPILKTETVAMAARNHIGTIPREPKDAGLRNALFGGMIDDPIAAKTPQSAGTLTFGGAWGHSGFMDKARGLSVVTLTNTAVEGVSGVFPTTIRDAIYAALAD